MRYQPPASVLDKFSDCNLLHISLWVTNLTNEKLVGYQRRHELVEGCRLDICVDRADRGCLWVPEIDLFFNGDFGLELSHRAKVVNGNYLRISVGSSLDQSTEYLRGLSRALAMEICFDLGWGAAAQLLFDCVCNIADNTTTAESPPFIPAEGLVGEGVDNFCYDAAGLHHRPHWGSPRMSPDVVTLLDTSRSSRQLWEKFLFAWIALETILGDGEKRSRFFSQRLASICINDEVKRLFGVRGKIAHEGSVAAVRIGDLTFLMRIIRLAVMPVDENSAVMVRLIEDGISRGI